MSVSKKEFSLEVEHLEEVKKLIRKIISKKDIDITEYKKSIVNSKRFLWEQKNEMYDKDLYAAMDEEDFNVSILNKDIVKVYKLHRSLECPYFSRIDFFSNDEVESFYIGLTGVDRDYEPVVYDWRASVANLYYNYGLGKAHFETPEGRVNGEVVLRRQFDIKMGEMKSIFDATSGIRDEYLESVLSENTSEAMKNIVGTIQREQNDVIRYPINKNLVVEGTSGSGKTSVALHRIAYILYNNKELSNKNVLVFSPSEEFSAYISNVLPELGEDNVPSATFRDLVEKTLGVASFSLQEEAMSFYEGKSVDVKSAQHKLSLAYKREIDDYLDSLYDRLKFTKKFGLKTSFISSARLNEIKDSIPRSLGFADRIERLSEKICAEFRIDEVKNARKLEKFIRKNLGISEDPLKLYEDFSGNHFDKIPYPDTVAMMYLHFEVNGYPDYSNIREVVIDEAQDYVPWQFELFRKIFRSASYTILGDKNQVINPYHRYTSLEDIAKIFEGEYLILNKAYRSSKEIVLFANDLIKENSVEAVRSESGNRVVEKQTSSIADIEEETKRLVEKGYNKIGIIVKTKSEKEKFDFLNHDNVSVSLVYEAKGLEYDACIVYTDKENYYRENEIGLLYIAVTRALHEVVIYNQIK
ncbi:MAG TPA: hypothetical protein DCY94_05230 [Firmicutes bacterium]|nr:hypothetical protein [Bacillota bacterium]